MRYINKLALGTTLVMLILIPLLEILYIIDTEDVMESEKSFVWTGDIS